MEKNKLSEKESLELITQMIQESRERIARHAAYPLLILGLHDVAALVGDVVCD